MKKVAVSSQKLVQHHILDLRAYLNTRILGQNNLVSRLLIALLADGHLRNIHDFILCFWISVRQAASF